MEIKCTLNLFLFVSRDTFSHIHNASFIANCLRLSCFDFVQRKRLEIRGNRLENTFSLSVYRSKCSYESCVLWFYRWIFWWYGMMQEHEKRSCSNQQMRKLLSHSLILLKSLILCELFFFILPKFDFFTWWCTRESKKKKNRNETK